MALVVLGSAALLMIGCRGASDAPPLVPVNGRVLVDGKAVGQLTVVFTPDNQKGTSGPASVGATTGDGTFTLTAPGNRPGAVPGFHRVTVACPFNPAAGSSPTGEQEATTGCSLPSAYADPSLTPVRIEVTTATTSSPIVIEISQKPETKP